VHKYRKLKPEEVMIFDIKKKKSIEAEDKATFAARISQVVQNEKTNEEVRAEAKRERQRKVVKDRAVKTETGSGAG
jgi:hypothetical protein